MADKLSDDSTADTGKSNLTPETFIELWDRRRKLLREKGEADGAVSSVKAQMKSVGVNLRALGILDTLDKLEDDEAEVVLKALVRYATWAGMPFAAKTGDLFVGMAIEKPTEKAQAEHNEARAEDEGYFAGYEGHKVDTCPAAYVPGAAFHVAWMKGWNLGQQALVAKTVARGDKGAGKKANGANRGTTAAAPRKPGRPKKGEQPAATA